MKIKTLTRLSLYCSCAIALSILEAQLSFSFPIPGIKLGLANSIILLILYTESAGSAFLVSLIRVAVVFFSHGSLITLCYSLSGAICSLACMWLLKKVFNRSFIWIISVFGSLFHVLSQCVVFWLIMQSDAILFYAPILIIVAIFSGLFNGLIVSFLLHSHLFFNKK